jgi:uncharacterized protein YggE
MKNIKLILAVFCLFTAFTQIFAQEKTERRIIEVTGSAETLIMPNEFTFKITLLERIENKQKITIEQQESKLKSELSSIGIDVEKDLSIFDISSNYNSYKKVKDTLGSKDYRLKLKDLEKIGKLQEIADRLNINRLDLIEATHSELTTYRKETKIEAIKAAKAKAEYLLGAIGEKVGKPVYIVEVNENGNNNMLISSLTNSVVGLTTGVIGGVQLNAIVEAAENKGQNVNLSFVKIKIRYEILAKFEIQ